MTLEKLEVVSGKFGQSLKWYWKGFHAEHGEIELTMMSSARLTPATKAGRAYRVLNRGVPVKVGEPKEKAEDHRLQEIKELASEFSAAKLLNDPMATSAREWLQKCDIGQGVARI